MISSTLLPQTVRHHKIWDSTVPSRDLAHTISTASGELTARVPSSELTTTFRWQPFDSIRHWPDLEPQLIKGRQWTRRTTPGAVDEDEWTDKLSDDKRNLHWFAVLKRTLEASIRGGTLSPYMKNISLRDLGGNDVSSPRSVWPV